MTETSGKTRLACVLGHPASHSASPALFSAAFAASGIDARYLAFDVPAKDLTEAVSALRLFGTLGASITAPHKQSVLALCDEVDARARSVGAVNTLVIGDDRRITGHNTDIAGFSDALQEVAPDARGSAVVLGAGGASRAVVCALEERGFSCAVVARRMKQAEELAPLGARAVAWTANVLEEELAQAAVLVDATSAELDAEPQWPSTIPVERLPQGATVASLVYHRDPVLLKTARSRGLRTMDGKRMLVLQAAHAFFLMTGQPAPVSVMAAAVE